MQNLVEDDIGGGVYIDTQVANYIQAELKLQTDTITDLNSGNGVTFATNVFVEDNIATKEFRIMNSNRDGYVTLDTNISPGVSYVFSLPSTTPSTNDVLVFNDSFESEWSKELTLNSITVENLQVTGLQMSGLDDGILVQSGTSTNSLPLLGITDGYIISKDSNSDIGITFTDVIDILDQTRIDHTNLQNIGVNTHEQIDTHIASTNNPHAVTINQITPTTTKGDLLVETGSNVIRLPVGTTGDILFGQPNETSGVQWANLYDYYPFGAFYTYGSSTATSTTTSTTYQTKLTVTTPSVPPGTYKVVVCYNWNLNAANRSAEFQVLFNGVQIIHHLKEPSDASDDNLHTGMVIGNLTTTSTHTILFQYRIFSGGTLTVSNVYLEFYRVS